MRKRKIRLTAFLAGAMMISTSTVSVYANKEIQLDPDNPQGLTVWHYYNGKQEQVFNELVEEFNDTVGAEEGIYVEAHSKGSINELSDAVNASANQEVGSDEMPDIFAAYSDTAYELNKEGMLVDINEYMTEDEISEYVDAYVKEGSLGQEGKLVVMPIAKSTEVFLLNETAWEEFEKETGADKSKLTTWEGICDIAKQYYEWTDAKTPDIEGDGQAFYGRDAFANYMIIGSMQLGKELFEVKDGEVSVQIDKDIMKKLWDCYYVPYVNGWFGAYGKFRSDDIKTGQIIALTGSTSGALYFPSEVTDENGVSHEIECGVYTVPNFEDTDPYAVQQGAGMVVVKSNEEREYAAVCFLKWITQAENNIKFSLNSGYLPVKKEANDMDVINNSIEEYCSNDLLMSIVNEGIATINNYTLYTSTAFTNADKARKAAEYNMPDAAKAAVEKRDELIAGGMSREEAIESLVNDEAFEAWLEAFEKQMNDVVNN